MYFSVIKEVGRMNIRSPLQFLPQNLLWLDFNHVFSEDGEFDLV